MKILILTQNWFPDVLGGSQRVAAEEARELAKRGHEVVVCAERIDATFPLHEQRDGITMWRYGQPWMRRLFGSSVTDALALPRLIRDLQKKYHFDSVVIHHAYPGYAYLRSRITVPMLYVFHASSALEAAVEGVTRWKRGVRQLFAPLVRRVFIQFTRNIERAILTRADRVVVFSQFSLKLLRETYPAVVKKAIVLPVGVDTDRFRPAKNRAALRRTLGLDPDTFYFFTVRRLTPRMGLHELVAAMKLVTAKNKSCHLFIAGKGALLDALKSQIKELRLKQSVTLLGALSDTKLVAYYQAADCFVLPTQSFEGFGMVTAEALSSGLPVVGTPAGATKEILSPIDKRLVSTGLTSNDIATAMLGFARLDDRERTSIRRIARTSIVERYSWPVAVCALEDVLQELV